MQQKTIAHKKDSVSLRSLHVDVLLTMVTHVDQTWNSLLAGLEKIDAAFDELEIGREQ